MLRVSAAGYIDQLSVVAADTLSLDAACCGMAVEYTHRKVIFSPLPAG
jgi:hypothetical protein